MKVYLLVTFLHTCQNMRKKIRQHLSNTDGCIKISCCSFKVVWCDLASQYCYVCTMPYTLTPQKKKLTQRQKYERWDQATRQLSWTLSLFSAFLHHRCLYRFQRFFPDPLKHCTNYKLFIFTASVDIIETLLPATKHSSAASFSWFWTTLF